MYVAAIIGLVLTLLGAGPAAAEGRAALVLGNAAYVHAPTLDNTLNDARAVAASLRGLGFEVVEGYDLDRAATTDAMRRFGRLLDAADVGLFFYAGHGLQVNGVNYVVPVDARLEDESDLLFEAVDLDTVMRLLEQRPRTSLVFLDSCRDNPLARNLARSMGAARSAGIGRGLARVDGGIGTLIAYATQPDNVALDGRGPHSPFTEALLAHIDEPGLEVRQMLSRVRQHVVRETGGRQVPWDHSSLTGDFYFSPPAPVAEAPAPPPSPPDVGAQTELLFWQSVQDSQDPADIEAYLARFPDGVFASLARNRLERLQRETTATLPPPREEPPPAREPAPQTAVPEPAPVIEPLGEDYVALRNANVRERPNVESERIGFLPEGTPVHVIGKPRGADWYQVALAEGGVGFVHAPLLGEPPPPAATAAVEPAIVTPSPAPPQPEPQPLPEPQVALAPAVVGAPGRDVAALVERLARPNPQARYGVSGAFSACDGAREFADWAPLAAADSAIRLAAPGFGGPEPAAAHRASSSRARAELAVFHGPEGHMGVEHNHLQLSTINASAWCDSDARMMLRHFDYLSRQAAETGRGGTFYGGRFYFRFVPFALSDAEGSLACGAFVATQRTHRINGFACRPGAGMLDQEALEGLVGGLSIRHVLN